LVSKYAKDVREFGVKLLSLVKYIINNDIVNITPFMFWELSDEGKTAILMNMYWWY
jgi:hypothetical protein